jgi:hypothetical protein
VLRKKNVAKRKQPLHSPLKRSQFSVALETSRNQMTELQALLNSLHLGHLEPILIERGAVDASDVFDISDDEWLDLGLTRIQLRRLRRQPKLRTRTHIFMFLFTLACVYTCARVNFQYKSHSCK